jgi:hypothetical protein
LPDIVEVNVTNYEGEIMQRLAVGTLGPCRRDALQEGSAAAVTCLPAPQVLGSWVFLFLLFFMVGAFQC